MALREQVGASPLELLDSGTQVERRLVQNFENRCDLAFVVHSTGFRDPAEPGHRKLSVTASGSPMRS